MGVSVTTVALLAVVSIATLSAASPSREPVSLSVNGPVSNSVASPSGHVWKLGNFNMTAHIDAAYRYGGRVVIFGWINRYVGITTILDAASGRERLEFLAYNPRITQKGVLVFRRFYPHFSDLEIVSEQIATLDLNGSIPRNVPGRQYQNPTDEVGTIIYPTASLRGIRHLIGDNFIITDRGTFVFLADRLSSGKLCLVRLPLQRGDGTQKMNCLESHDLGVRDIASELHIQKLTEDSPTTLRLSVDLGPLPVPRHRDLTVDKTSLAVSVRSDADAAVERPLRVPWPAQRDGLIGSMGINVTDKEIAAHLHHSVHIRLTIDYDGSVRTIFVSGVTSDVSELLKKMILRWRFKPTVLDGRNVQVVTEFTADIESLTKRPN